MTEKIIKILESYESLDENGNEYIKPKDYNSLASKLLEAINYTRCSEQLKDKWDITFEQWIELYYTPYNATYMTNKHGILKTKKELRKYFDELKQSL